MTHLMQPSPEQFADWLADAVKDGVHGRIGVVCEQIARNAYAAGADAELEACVEWLEKQKLCGHRDLIPQLRSTRRPKPQTLNSIALQMLGTIESDARYLPEITGTIRRALEELSDD